MTDDADVTEVTIAHHIQVMRRKNKIKRSEYLDEGTVPVIDQGAQFIAGYIHEEDRAYDGPLPVIVFGDHTCSVKYADFRFAVGADGTQLIRPKDENQFHPRYLYYCLRNAPLEQFGYQRHFKYLKESKILWRPMVVQRKIVAILSAYDDLIENNLRRIEVLEEMAQLIYREWFVKFRFPGHEKVRMVDSPLGKIPKGWEISSVSDAVQINPKTAVPKETEKPYVPMASLCTDSMIITESETRTGSAGSKFRNHDTLMARITPSIEHGKTGFVQFLSSQAEVAIGSTELIVLRSNTLNPYYVYFLARTEDLRQHAIKSMTGASGRQRVQIRCFDEYHFAHPDKQNLDRFASIAAPMFGKIHILWKTNRNLGDTRDLLLPKLISGELNVADLDMKVPEEPI